MTGSEIDIVGLFPAFASGRFGGVQASGREAWRGIVNAVGRERADVLYYEAGDSKAKVVLRAIRSRRKARVILVWHLHLLKLLPFLDCSSSRVILFLHGIEAWFKPDLLTRLLLKRVSLILSNSDHTWRKFVQSNPMFAAVPHLTVHLGTDSSLRATTPSPSNLPVVLMVGRLAAGEDYKGHRQMIEAWPRVLERIPEAELWIVGTGDLRASLEEVARRCVPNRSVRFWGEISDQEKEQMLSQCRCLAMPSRGEGFGLVYLEAMRVGRPCLVSNVDAGREVINPPEAGLAVSPDDPGEIVDAIHRMTTTGAEWKQWSDRARSRYENCFTGEHFQRRLVTAVFGAT
jgi:phosphatidylinositol alpha-1,6-mannosyltransferase